MAYPRLGSGAITIPILYINDNQTSSKNFDFFLFPDDTNLLFADKNLKSLESIETQN